MALLLRYVYYVALYALRPPCQTGKTPAVAGGRVEASAPIRRSYFPFEADEPGFEALSAGMVFLEGRIDRCQEFREEYVGFPE